MGLIRCDHCGWGNNPEDAKRCQKCNQELVVPDSEPTPDMFETVKKSVISDCSKCGYPLSPEISFCPNCGAPVGVASPAAPVAVHSTPLPQTAVDHAMKATMRDVSEDTFRTMVPEQPVVPAQPAAPVVSPALNKTVRIGETPFFDEPVSAPAPAPVPTPTPAPTPIQSTVPVSSVGYPAVTKKILPETAVAFRLKPIDIEAAEAFAFGADTNAAFEFEDGQWFVTDGGSNTTYVSAARRMPLEKGDVLLIGGRRYLFDE